MNLNLKNENGISMIILVVTIIIMFIIISAVTFTARNGVDFKRLNNMITDIILLEEKIAVYYLENDKLPLGDKVADDKIPSEIKNINPNDLPDNYYYIKTSKLDNIDLNNGNDMADPTDRYIINAKSHCIYYLAGINLEEYDTTSVQKVDRSIYYTVPREYTKIKIEEVATSIVDNSK